MLREAIRAVLAAIILAASVASANGVTKVDGCWTVRPTDEASGVLTGADEFEFPAKVCLSGRILTNRDETHDLKVTRVDPRSEATEYSETVRGREIEGEDDEGIVGFRILMSHEIRFDDEKIGASSEETKHYLILEIDLDEGLVAKTSVVKEFRWLPPLNDHRVEAMPGRWQRSAVLELTTVEQAQGNDR
jgi:hypothetical protein